MFQAQVAGYLGKQPNNGFIGFANEGPFVIVLAVEEGIDTDTGNSILYDIKSTILHEHITSLSTFETLLSSQIFKHNLPAHFSLAAGYLYQDTLFIKTVGNGQIYFRRGKDFALLLTGDKNAEGSVQEYDCAVFTTHAIQQVLGNVQDIQLFVDMNAPQDIVEKLQNEEYDEEERGFIATFVECTTQSPNTVGNIHLQAINPFADHISEKEPVTGPIGTSSREEEKIVHSPKKYNIFSYLNWKGSKKIALVLSVILFGVLLWSVVFGYQRREAAPFAAKVEEVEEDVNTKLAKAEQESFLNLDTSMDLITQSKEAVTNLKSESKGRNANEIIAIETTIKKAESNILKKEEKPYEEFYDLALEEKTANGSSLAEEGENVALLDAKNKTVYLLSLSKKSLKKYTSPELTDSTLVSLYDETIYFFSKKKGIFKFTTENKVKNIIKSDTDWGEIIDFEIFNGNIYLLDQNAEQLYKYVPTEGGYSEKASYFNSDSVDISGASGLSIDSAVYISANDSVKKFTRGEEEKFETDFPNKTVQLNGIYTNADIEQIYVWDKKQSVVYILEKDGSYIRQIQTSALKNANCLFVREKTLYILVGSKIYTISLD